MLELDYVWESSGSSGAVGSPVYLAAGCMESALYIQSSTLASTQSVALRTAQESTGPWFVEASTSLSTGTAQQAVLRITGPYKWAQPYLNSASTGTYKFRLVANS